MEIDKEVKIEKGKISYCTLEQHAHAGVGYSQLDLYHRRFFHFDLV
jgi:hypothetical protein